MSEGAVQQALALARAGQTAAAERALHQILAAAPDRPDALQLLGMIARGRKDNAAAAAYFRRALAVRPDQPDVLNTLGNTLRDLGRTDEAIAAYREAVRRRPGFGEALTNLGLAHLAADDADAARGVLEEATQADGRSAKAWSALGRALRALGRLPAALEAFDKALAIRPGHVPTLHNYAIALRLAGRAAEAAAILEQCAAASPNTAAIHYNLGHCHYDLGRLDAAAACYEQAVALNPGDRDSHDSLNRLYWQTGNHARYLASYARVLQHDPNDAGLLADLANRLSLGGRTGEAAQMLEAALARGVGGGEIHERLGQALAAAGEHDRALGAFAAAIAAAPEGKGARLDMVRTLIVRERYDEALAALEPVIERHPDDQQAIAFQALAWRFLGDPRAAALDDYDRLIAERTLEPPAEWGGVAAFNRRLEAALVKLHVTSEYPLEQTLRQGTQTMGELFDQPAPEIRAVKGMIEQAVAAYIAALPDDADHPFLRRKAAGFRFAGSWSVRLRRQGFHLNHVHSEGWISSCYYVGLPPAVARGDGEQGWIKFGETALALGSRERVARAIRPAVGKLVLFPSYFYHGTVPFDDDAHRTTIAFDVVPERR